MGEAIRGLNRETFNLIRDIVLCLFPECNKGKGEQKSTWRNILDCLGELQFAASWCTKQVNFNVTDGSKMTTVYKNMSP